jgi:hypothetical protein
MTTGQTMVVDALVALRQKLELVAEASPVTFGTIVAVDSVHNTVGVNVNGVVIQSGALALSNYLPEVGHQVMIAMNGADPVIIAPPGPPTSLPPSVVTGVTVAAGILSLTVAWTAVTDLDVIYGRGTYEAQTDTVNTFSSGALTDNISGGTSIQVTGLTAATLYYVRVRAVDQSGVPGPWSATATGTPLAIPPSTAGLPIVHALPALPNGTYPNGTVIVLDLDWKLYRNAGGAWTDATDGADIIANTITGAKIVAGAISSSLLAAGAVTAGKIAAGAVTAGTIAANAVAAGTVDASVITGREIAAVNLTVGTYIRSTTYVAGTSGFTVNADGTAEFNQVTVRGNVTAGSITASQITANEGANLVPNPGAEVNTTGWAATNCVLTRDTVTFRSGVGAFKLVASSAAQISMRTPAGLAGIPVEALATYVARAWARPATSSGVTLQLTIYYYDATGALLGNNTTIGSTGMRPGSWWNELTPERVGAWAFPVAAFAAIEIDINGHANGEAIYVDDVFFVKTSTIVGTIVTNSSLGQYAYLDSTSNGGVGLTMVDGGGGLSWVRGQENAGKQPYLYLKGPSYDATFANIKIAGGDASVGGDFSQVIIEGARIDLVYQGVLASSGAPGPAVGAPGKVSVYADTGPIVALIGSTTYTPAANYPAGLAIADVDATNLRVSFTAPKSGIVIAELVATGLVATTSANAWTAFNWLLRDLSNVVVPNSTIQVLSLNISTTGVWTGLPVYKVRITGLTPGTVYTWKWAHIYNMVFGGTGSATTGVAALAMNMFVWGVLS